MDYRSHLPSHIPLRQHQNSWHDWSANRSPPHAPHRPPKSTHPFADQSPAPPVSPHPPSASSAQSPPSASSAESPPSASTAHSPPPFVHEQPLSQTHPRRSSTSNRSRKIRSCKAARCKHKWNTVQKVGGCIPSGVPGTVSSPTSPCSPATAPPPFDDPAASACEGPELRARVAMTCAEFEIELRRV